MISRVWWAHCIIQAVKHITLCYLLLLTNIDIFPIQFSSSIIYCYGVAAHSPEEYTELHVYSIEIENKTRIVSGI